jgi:cell division protein FtsL
MENNQQESLLQFHVDYDGGNILKETVRWSRFLSIVGIIGIVLCALVFALAGSAILAAFSTLSPGLGALANMGGVIVIIICLIIFAIAAYVVFMLYRFSTLTRKAIDQQDQALFAEGMKCLKMYFVVNGVLAVLSLLFSLLSITSLFHS